MSANPNTASDWFALHREGATEPARDRAFQTWLDADPSNRIDYDRVASAWRTAGALYDHPEILQMREAARRRYPGVPRFAIGAAAASLLAVASLSGWAIWRAADLEQSRTYRPATYATKIGERSVVRLPDGSRVTLDTDTMVMVAAVPGERRLELLRGRALFQVAHDRARPFLVRAGGRTVVATGTAFNVRLDDDRVEVALIEGSVRVEEQERGKGGRVVRMEAGRRLIARDERRWQVGKLDTAQETGWISGRLTFDNQPLATVAEELNRYSDRKIVIADPGIAQSPIVGVFDAGDPDEFVRLVTESGIARADASGERVITLVAPR